MGYLLAFHLSSLGGKIARHEIPDWCANPPIPYPHCVGQATTLDVGCYPPSAGAGSGAPGSDILPPRRQTVVDRLKRRLEVYRRHQGSCQPRYDQAANGIYDAQRQETLLLKQKFLEAKAKKTRRNDHHGRNNTGGDQGQRNNTVNHSKLKRQASPLLDCAIDNISDGHANKISRTAVANDSFCNSKSSQQSQQPPNQQSSIPSFSVQIVQQFSSNTSQSHSQTIQTNVTVQALSNNSIKTSNSPLASNAISSTSSPGCAGAGTSVNDSCNQISNSTTNNNTGSVQSTSISVGSNVECKQEPGTNFPQCSVNGSRTLPELETELASANNANSTNTSTAATTGDRFSDSLANLGFPEDSNDDVIHPDILKDIIDDVFTNSSDLMNGFNFVDNIDMKDSNQNINDDKDSLKPIMSLNKSIQNSPPNNFQNSANSPSLFTMSQSQQSVFDFQTAVNSNNNSQSVPNNANSVNQGYQSNRLGSYAASSPNLPGISNNGLGLDFKLTEPSPAAQTLKQMAEQHQSMQQKQQQLNLGIGTNHPRSPFGSDSFPDPLTNIRTNFMNGSPTSVQKSPTGLFQPMGFSQQQNFTTSGSNIKQEVVTPNTPIYQSNINQHLPDIDLHKRRQVMQMQQGPMGTLTRPPFSRSPDQKRQFQGMRNLPHYNDPSPSHPPNESSASNSPVPHHPGQFMRGVPTPGVTPPPQGFGSSPSPSAGSTLHMSQSQQIQMSANNQQIQMSQSQQHLILNQDSTAQRTGQQAHLYQGFYTNNANNLHIIQSSNFFNNTSPRVGHVVMNQKSNVGNHPAPTQRQIPNQYISKPPPDYVPPVENNYSNPPVQSSICSKTQLEVDSVTNEQRNEQRNSVKISQSYNLSSSDVTSQSYPGVIPFNQIYSDLFPPDTNTVSTPRVCPTVSSSNPNSNIRRPYSGHPTISDLIMRPCESPNNDNSAEHRPYSGIMPINDLIKRSCANEPNSNGRKYSNVTHGDLLSRQDDIPNSSNSDKPFPGVDPISNLISGNNTDQINSRKPVSESNDRCFSDISVQDINNSRQTYTGLMSIEEALSLNSGCQNSGAVPNNNMSNLRTYPSVAYSHASSTSVSSPFSSVGTVPVQTFSKSSQMLSNTGTLQSTTNKARGKQINNRSNSKNCSTLQRQQKAPNVNVGPEGLNISQRPPLMPSDWRQNYIRNQHQIPTSLNDDVIVTFSRNGAQEYRTINTSVNNFNSAQVNSSIGDTHSVLSQSTNHSRMQSNSLQDLDAGSANQLMLQSDSSINANSSFPSTLSVSTSDINQSNIFSTSSPNNLQNVSADSSNQFNLDFLDNMDCSASDLLNFDVMQGEGSNFPLLDDISMLDK